jgi:hypothetical protein
VSVPDDFNAEAQRPQRVAEKSNSTQFPVKPALRFSVNSPQKRIALATGRRIIAINLPVVGEVKPAPASTTQQ